MAGALNDAHMTALCIRIDPKSTILPTEQVLTKKREDELNRLSIERATGVYRIYQEWREANASFAEGRTDWDDPISTIESEVGQRGRDADLIVLPRPTSMRDFYGRLAVRTAIFEAERPVLLVPNTRTPSLGQSIAILWDDEKPTLRAVLDALPRAGARRARLPAK